MPEESTRKDGGYPFARLLADLRRRHPGRLPAEAPEPAQPPLDAAFSARLEKLPREVGVLLVAVGVAGVLLPGPVGAPFLLAGGLVLWPRGTARFEGWFKRKFPALHREGVAQIDRFLGDLDRRYPGSLGSLEPPQADGPTA